MLKCSYSRKIFRTTFAKNGFLSIKLNMVYLHTHDITETQHDEQFCAYKSVDMFSMKKQSSA
jgi:hypothetical protein